MNLFEEKKPNKTTLYRILTRLETASLLRIIPTTSGNKFESSTKPNHLHQICSQCQSTFCTQILLESNISSLEKIVCKDCI
jgi:Fe2+ or Zn2+ uptake regulation protein